MWSFDVSGKKTEELHFKVLWKPCLENRYAIDETTWESEERMRADGHGKRVDDIFDNITNA